MDEGDKLSNLIGDIYDAALDGALWPSVLERMTGFVVGHGATLFYKNASLRTGGALFEWGMDPAYRDLYFERYVQLDAATVRHCFATIDEPMATADLVPYDEFLESRFYREWARPQDLVDFVAVVLDKSAASAALFGVFRHKRHGIVDDDARRRMRLLAPHVRRAALIGRLIDLKSAEAAAVADALDTVNAGVFLVDTAKSVVHANTAGQAMVQSGHLLRAPGGTLTAGDGVADTILAGAIAAAQAGDRAVGTDAIAVSLGKQDGVPFVAHVLPLTSGARRQAGQRHSAVAAVFVRKTSMEGPLLPEVIAHTYRLTPTELRVLLAIVEVGGVPDVAQALGIAETTVKTHLGRVYQKTDTRRQADLVKLVAGFSSPLTG